MGLVGAPLLVNFVWGVMSAGGDAATEPSESPSSVPSPDQSDQSDQPGRPGRPDLYASALHMPNDTSCTALATAPTSVADRAELAAGGDHSALITRHDGAMLGQLDIGITLQGGERALTIESIDIEPRASRPESPLDGALLCSVGQGDESRLELAANMDDPAPYIYEEGAPARPHFRDRVITLAPQEQMSLAVSFQAEEGYREFEIVVRYVLDGQRGSLSIPDPHGGRYAVTGPADAYNVGYLNTVTGSRQMDSGEICQWSGIGEDC